MSIVTIIGLLGIALSNPIDYKDATAFEGTIERFTLKEAMNRGNSYIKGLIQKQLNNADDGKPIRYAYWVQKDFMVTLNSYVSITAPIQKFTKANESYTAPVMQVSLDPSVALLSYSKRNVAADITYTIVEIDTECTNSKEHQMTIGVYKDSTSNYHLTFVPSFLKYNYNQITDKQLNKFYREEHPLTIPKECYKSFSIPSDEISKTLSEQDKLHSLDVLLQDYWPFETAQNVGSSKIRDDSDGHKLFDK